MPARLSVMDCYLNPPSYWAWWALVVAATKELPAVVGRCRWRWWRDWRWEGPWRQRWTRRRSSPRLDADRRRGAAPAGWRLTFRGAAADAASYCGRDSCSNRCPCGRPDRSRRPCCSRPSATCCDLKGIPITNHDTTTKANWWKRGGGRKRNFTDDWNFPRANAPARSHSCCLDVVTTSEQDKTNLQTLCWGRWIKANKNGELSLIFF